MRPLLLDAEAGEVDVVNGYGRRLAGLGLVADEGPFSAGSRRIPRERSEGERDPRSRSRGRLLLTEEKFRKLGERRGKVEDGREESRGAGQHCWGAHR